MDEDDLCPPSIRSFSSARTARAIAAGAMLGTGILSRAQDPDERFEIVCYPSVRPAAYL